MRRYMAAAQDRTGADNSLSKMPEFALGYATERGHQVIGNTKLEWLIAIGATIGLVIVVLI